MKNCSYCGKENDEDASYCRECGTNEFAAPQPVESATDGAAFTEQTSLSELDFLTPTPQEMQQTLVNLIRCRTLGEADLMVAQLEAGGIPAFIPDQFLMQNVGFNLNTYGYVRIQVSPKRLRGCERAALGLLTDCMEGEFWPREFDLFVGQCNRGLIRLETGSALALPPGGQVSVPFRQHADEYAVEAAAKNTDERIAALHGQP